MTCSLSSNGCLLDERDHVRQDRAAARFLAEFGDGLMSSHNLRIRSDLTMANNRKRAPTTGTALDFIRVPVPCPKCGQHDLQLLAELLANDATACRFCGHVIDLTAEDWPARLADEARQAMQIKPVSR
jgi:hypothetical protein